LICIISGNTLTCVNAGNSRATLFYEVDGKITPKQLTFDHDTWNEKEVKRVKTWGADVRPPRDDENGQLRVYKEN